MTVAELIQKLQEMPQNAIVYPYVNEDSMNRARNVVLTDDYGNCDLYFKGDNPAAYGGKLAVFISDE
jgi:hypothetical protein